MDQKEAMETALFKHFAEIEMRRVKTEKNQRSLDKVMKEGDESQAEIVSLSFICLISFPMIGLFR